ncbi:MULTISPECIES: phosphoenolpyruvate--protein phosphotransferase [Kocuria]|jgi:phosphotransferase system enzyme I (PtsI)|uniref:phosphoenolpyruvate--protein phosphotransferase n=1 Tax=Kocuria TaxID=57493 RepID=UPI00203B21D4|nr:MULTISPECIES: phosphoenolpyruvate--protein phosphotransferase [Kocuria]MCM3689256.1 phosphoenolpyruvate--protein phosphotransferase [Kocuria rosea]HST71186.1 phosphoenolpyruvate--protein phosphotransferase [Kocuria rosea]
MQTLTGVGVCAGRVIGELVSMPAPVGEPAPGLALRDEEPEAAVARLQQAAAEVKAELKARAEAATEKDAADVLKSTALMAGDKALLKNASKLITGRGLAPERALWEAASAYADQMRALGGYMAERAADIEDVRARLVARLQGLPMPGIPQRDTPFVLTAEDLAPADTATLDPEKVLALVTSGGGPQSHTAILARNLGLPAIVAARGVEAISDGTRIFVDGASGEVRTEPGLTEQALVEAWLRSAEARSAFDGHGVLADGTEVPLYANVGTPDDARTAAAAGAQGVGLLRTEFCFLGRDQEPTVEEQVEQYAAIFEAFAGKKVVVRTLDAGADKPLPFLTDTDEPNPALGVRGYRTDRSVPGVLARQLEAIARARELTGAHVWVMAPMISAAGEARDFAAMVAAAGLRVPGVMVETPSAAVTADQILRHVEFVSLGTNDLTQYTMAADRMLGSLAELNSPWQPAVLRMVGLTVEGALRAEAAGGGRRNVGVCGEAAADPALAVVLVGLGVHTLSMSPRALAAVAAVLRTVDLTTARELAQLAVDQSSAEDAAAAVRAQLPVLAELGL